MTKTYLSNAFSLQMIDAPAIISVIELTTAEFESIKTSATSCVGHPDTAAVLGVACNRISVKLEQGDTLIVAQLVGGRLPEGATTLPDGFSFKFLKVEIL